MLDVGTQLFVQYQGPGPRLSAWCGVKQLWGVCPLASNSELWSLPPRHTKPFIFTDRAAYTPVLRMSHTL